MPGDNARERAIGTISLGRVKSLEAEGLVVIDAELLTELAEAERDCSAHFERFPERDGDGAHLAWDQQSEACHEDWYRCCTRRDAVREVIANLALARYPAAEVA